MTLQELMAKILEVCPRAIVYEDMGGELVFATGYQYPLEGVDLVPVPDPLSPEGM
jgi:hypothetical protein